MSLFWAFCYGARTSGRSPGRRYRVGDSSAAAGPDPWIVVAFLRQAGIGRIVTVLGLVRAVGKVA